MGFWFKVQLLNVYLFTKSFGYLGCFLEPLLLERFAILLVLDGKEAEGVGIVQAHGDVGAVEVAPQLGGIHVAVFIEGGRGGEDMILLERIGETDIAADVQTLALALHLVIYKGYGAGDVQGILLEEGVPRGERPNAAQVFRLVTPGLLVAHGEAEVCGPWLDAERVAGAESGGLHVALARGKAVKVGVLGIVEGERGRMSHGLVFFHVGRSEGEARRASVYPDGVIDDGRAVALHLCVAIVAGCQIEVVTDAGGGHGGIDETTRGVHLLVGEVVALPGEGTAQGDASEERGIHVDAQRVIVVGHVVGAERRVVGLHQTICD